MTINDILTAAGITQAQMSRDLGIPINTLSQWCRGIRQAPEYIIKLIAEHYGIK